MSDVIQRADELRFRRGISHPVFRHLATAIAEAKNARPYASRPLDTLRQSRGALELAAAGDAELAALWPQLAEALDRGIAKALIPGVGCEFCKTGCPVCQEQPADEPVLTPGGAGRPQEHLPQQAGPLLPG